MKGINVKLWNLGGRPFLPLWILQICQALRTTLRHSHVMACNLLQWNSLLLHRFATKALATSCTSHLSLRTSTLNACSPDNFHCKHLNMADQPDHLVVGVDFGTTFSGVAAAYSGNPEAPDEISVIKTCVKCDPF